MGHKYSAPTRNVQRKSLGWHQNW